MSTLLTAMTAAGTNRKNLLKRWAYEMSRGKTGGAAGMNLFDVTGYSNESEAAINAYHNARDPGETPYVFNPNLWCAELLPQLSCLVVHKDDCGTGEGAAGAAWRARFGGVAVTPRHVLYCGHSFTHAAGTWSGGMGITDPTRLRFIGTDGVTVDRTQIHQASAYTDVSNAANENGTNYADMCVAVLDSPLPETVYIPAVAPSEPWIDDYDIIALSQEFQPQSDGSQGEGNSEWGDYPARNRQMVYIRKALGVVNVPHIQEADPYPPAPDHLYAIWGGDSGTPSFIRHNGSLVVNGTIGGDDAMAHPRGSFTFAGRINALITLADAAAIALGRLASPTGYTVTEASP